MAMELHIFYCLVTSDTTPQCATTALTSTSTMRPVVLSAARLLPCFQLLPLLKPAHTPVRESSFRGW